MTERLFQQLLADISEVESRYIAAREGQQYDFNNDIVPFVSQIDAHLTQTEQETQQFIAQRERIETLLKTLSVSCHDARTSKKQFYDQLKTVKHDIMTIMQ